MPDATADRFRPFASEEARKLFLAHVEMLEQSWPVEYEARTVPGEYGETFARVSGPVDAMPVVLLPGGQSSSLVWRRLIEPLSVRFRTYGVDAIYDVRGIDVLDGTPLLDLKPYVHRFDAIDSANDGWVAGREFRGKPAGRE